MMAADPQIIRRIIGGITLVLFYGFSFWRISKANPGNRVVECGSITLVVFTVMLASMRIPNSPAWISALLGLLVLILGSLTTFFLLQRGYRALRRRKTH